MASIKLDRVSKTFGNKTAVGNVVALVFIGWSALLFVADIINPVQLF